MISFLIPLKAVSVANLREHWRVARKRVQAQRNAARMKCPRWTGGPFLAVTLTRVGVRELDDDNLRSALKAFRDGVAARLGVDDASPLVRWAYAQEKGEPGVRVDIGVIGIDVSEHG